MAHISGWTSLYRRSWDFLQWCFITAFLSVFFCFVFMGSGVGVQGHSCWFLDNY